MVNMSQRQQPHWDDDCQLKAIHWSLLNEEETLTPHGRLQHDQKQLSTQVQRNNYPHILQQQRLNRK